MSDKNKVNEQHKPTPGAGASTRALHEQLGAEKSDSELLTHPSHAELIKKLDEAEEKVQQHWEKIVRQQAEIDNIQRRTARDVANAHKYSLEKFVNELLPIVDSLERSIELMGGQQSVDEGVNLTLRMLLTALEKFGIKQLNPIQAPFNPEFHEAVSTQEDATVKPGTVLAVLQKGYLLNDRLVRPALVVVSKAPA